MIDPKTAWTAVTKVFRDEDGAATVDWVVLTAAIALTGVGAGFYVTSTIPDLADRISS
ncbi:hypothetical protein [Sinisalibacter aestuarii]|uniref:Pilus assembly protein n=1 Tax=Sinisalibacter aestuarii TaxID=2949426 RepID=A0ABQ5LQ82_9RHOB|nr:hypothetical protein [Sinisalibacter aestuarii]GKY87165.1 hypothetical protein STA1M1_10340 [Sinisalibacter aestuarii]